MKNIKKITLPEIIGLPPTGSFNKDYILRSMPVAEITPSDPKPEFGLTVFTLENKFKDYNKILNNHGFNIQGEKLKLAFLADNFPTDSFSNEYGEGIAEKLTSAVSGAVSSVQQMMGARTVGESFDVVTDTFKDIGGTVGNVGTAAGTAVKSAMNSLDNMVSSTNPNLAKFGKKLGSIAGSMLAGSRIDFPQIWKNSTFQPSYTMTVRLYNPNPANDIATAKYIIGPIAAILLLGLPQSVDGSTYNFPYLHKIECNGIYFLNPCYISNISVIKGGDQQSIHWNQRLGMVDVRIDFGSLYSSIIVGKKDYESENRPNLENYLNVMLNTKEGQIDPKKNKDSGLSTPSGAGTPSGYSEEAIGRLSDNDTNAALNAKTGITSTA